MATTERPSNSRQTPRRSRSRVTGSGRPIRRSSRQGVGAVWQIVCLIAVGVVSFAPPSPLQVNAQDELSARQTGVAKRYQKLEELLLRLAEVEAAENPQRASLLRRAARQSRDKFILDKLRNASEAIESQQFQDAIDSQDSAVSELDSLLKLLLTEDRSKRIRDEKQRISEIIDGLRRTERAQRSTRARTENGAELRDVSGEQKSITDRADDLNRELSGDEDADADGGEDEPNTADAAQRESESDEPESSGDSQGDNELDEGEEDGEGGKSSPRAQPSEAEQDAGEGSESSPGDESSPGESDPQPGRPSESPDSQSPQSQPRPQQGQSQQGQQGQQGQQQQAPQTPEQQAEKQLNDAIEKMQQAERDLEAAKREQAVARQREAEEKLRSAIERLERILRQLREEEIQRELARLEKRLRKMAAMQSQVLDDCTGLAQTPESQRNRKTDLKAGDLAFEEKKITLEADRAMLLLREEGSSVAFPEVLDQVRSDTIRVTERLSETKIDAVTQGIQQDILAALEEMIEALQKAQRDLEQQRQQQPQQGGPQQGKPGEQPLVQALAELKLIRTMEKRIKSTTERYSDLIEAGETTATQVRPLLETLAERQDRLYRITRDLVLERNQ